MELGDNFFLRETCKLHHSFGKVPVLVEIEYNPIENQHYKVFTMECLKCGFIKLIKNKID